MIKSRQSKKIIFSLLVLVMCISAAFAYSLNANEVGFSGTDSAWQADNVEKAINDLYRWERTDRLVTYFRTANEGNYSTISVTNYMIFNTNLHDLYHYFKITGATCSTNVTERRTRGDKGGNFVLLTNNVEYVFADYANIWTEVEGTGSYYCDVTIEFYNKK